MASKIPNGLKNWFFIHFLIDMFFGIPILLFPGFVFSLFNLPLEIITSRLVGASLIGIGGASFFARKFEEYNILLTLKIVWSISGILALILSSFYTDSKKLYFIIGIFVVFSITWIYYKIKINRK